MSRQHERPATVRDHELNVNPRTVVESLSPAALSHAGTGTAATESFAQKERQG